MPLDIRKIARDGLLISRKTFSWQWLVNGSQVAGISVEVDFEGLVLFYCKKSTGEVVEQEVQTQMTSCNFG